MTTLDNLPNELSQSPLSSYVASRTTMQESITHPISDVRSITRANSIATRFTTTPSHSGTSKISTCMAVSHRITNIRSGRAILLVRSLSLGTRKKESFRVGSGRFLISVETCVRLLGILFQRQIMSLKNASIDHDVTYDQVQVSEERRR